MRHPGIARILCVTAVCTMAIGTLLLPASAAPAGDAPPTVAPLAIPPAGPVSPPAVGPYLLDVTTNEATVAVHLDRASSATVTVYDSARRVGTFRSAGPARRHFVRITGLAPGRQYRYEVTCDDAGVRTPPGDRRYQIRTAALAGEAFTFAVYGDPRPGDTRTQRHHRQVLAEVAAAEPSLCLVLGDMVDDGASAAAWRDFFRVESPVARRAAIYTVMGDNDYAGGKGLQGTYLPKLDRGYYHFESGGVHFFALRAWDTRGAQPQSELDENSPQARWLTEQLARKDVREAPYRVVFMHDPVYICRGRSADVMREVWAPIFTEGRVDVVFASWHLYERAFHGGVHYILTGGAGAELVWMDRNEAYPSQAEARRHHFCRVDVSAADMRIRAVADDGTVLDNVILPRRAASGQAAARLQRSARRLGRKTLIRGGPDDAPALGAYLFSTNCAYCRTLTDTLLPRWAARHGVTLDLTTYELSRRGAHDLLLNIEADFGHHELDIPALFVGTRAMGGPRQIDAALPGELASFARAPQAYLDRAVVPFQQVRSASALRARAFDALSVAVVLGAGLLDGVNPCAFTTIIFLISYLHLIGSGRRRMLLTGGAFALGVFVAYMLIGMFLFEIAAWLLVRQTAATVLDVLILTALGVLALLSFIDFVRCLQGRPDRSLLQLPPFLKAPLRDRIRRFARHRAGAPAAALALGAIVAALELGCTGQVYLPIVRMIAEPAYRTSAMAYLLMYNLAFIAPLIVVFLLATFGVTSQRLAAAFGRRIAWVKLALAVLFSALAALILHNMPPIG